MIVRLWWPLQETVCRHRRYAVVGLVGMSCGAIAGVASADGLGPLPLALLAGALAVVVQVHGIAAQVLAGAALMIALALVSVGWVGTREWALIVPSVALLLGPGTELARGRPTAHAQHAIGRATSFLTMGLQLIVISAWDRPAVLFSTTVATLIAITLVVPLATRATRTGQAELLSMQSSARWNRWVVPLVLLPLGPALGWRNGDPLSVDQLMPILIPISILWGLLSQRPLLTLTAALGTATGAALVVVTDIAGDRAAIGAAQLIPLLTWLGRTSQGGVSWPVQLGATALLCATALVVPGWMPAGLIALGTTIGLACCPDPSPTPGLGLRAVRRWLKRLEPYWRWYGLAKLRFDPLYAQLAADQRPWGRTLDLGCGPGLAAALAAARRDVTSYHGIDLDRDKLLVARRVLHLAGHDLDDAWRLEQAAAPLDAPPAGPFDTVLLLDVLHYWPRTKQAAVLAQVHGLLADDGQLWLREGIAERGRIVQGERFTTWLGLNPRGTLHFFDQDNLSELLCSCGFTVISIIASGSDNRLFSVRKSLAGIARKLSANPSDQQGDVSLTAKTCETGTKQGQREKQTPIEP